VKTAILPVSIPMTRSLRNTWKNTGSVFLRDRPLKANIRKTRDLDIDVLLNLGNTNYPLTDEIRNTLTNEQIRYYNPANIILQYNTPGRIRRSNLAPFLPENSNYDDEFSWLKGPGRAGMNKTKVLSNERPLFIPGENWDFQRHIDGQEYRIHSVKDKIVQVHRRQGDNTARQYEWLGLQGRPPGVLPFIKNMITLMEYPYIVYAWDVIQEHHTNKWYLLEVNSNPGVNPMTVRRIINIMHEEG
jgi:hypothetical protein